MRRVFQWLPVFLCLAITACSPSNSHSSSSTNIIIDRGSDTLVNLALAWAEAYAKVDPSVSISVSGGGSGVGLTALIEKTTDIANASRAIKPEEVQSAKDNGVNPVEFIVARDAISVIVNPSNPINQLTLQQVSDIFSGKISNWKDLGGENRPIVRVSREVTSGTHVYFLESVIRLGNSEDKTIFAADTLLLASSEGIMSEVGQNPNAIGYDGLGYITPYVKKIRLAKDPNGPFIEPTVATALDGTYPISRDLYMYTNGEPTGKVKEYLDWILSPEGQKVVSDLGFVPILRGSGG
jgi:phosphate transport system substrate-binding protein